MIILLYSKKTTRRDRALRRPGMNNALFNKIIKNQLGDVFKKKKSNFIIDSNSSKTKTYLQITKAIEVIMKKNA